MSVDHENWRWVEGFEGLYMVSNMGRVMGVPRRTYPGHVLSQRTNKHGYKVVCLCKNNAKRYLSVHRIVAQAFVPNSDGKPEVNHINGSKVDNRASNLEWATRSDNELHSHRVLGKPTHSPWKGKPRKFARLFTDDQIRSIRTDGRSNPEIAKDFGVSKTTIRNIKTRKVYFDVD